jgi:hypothetical protein
LLIRQMDQQQVGLADRFNQELAIERAAGDCALSRAFDAEDGAGDAR